MINTLQFALLLKTVTKPFSASIFFTASMMSRENENPLTAATMRADGSLSSLHQLRMLRAPRTENKKRFSDDQIKSLEVMFESESRPESKTKQQLANKLGLEPRQVAIWFQNRRARMKTKQIEKDYKILKERYDALAGSYESLKREKESLLIQLQRLKNLQVRHHCWSGQAGGGSEGKLETRVAGSDISESIEKPCLQAGMPASDDHEFNKVGTDILNLSESITITSSGWHGLESSGFLDDQYSSCCSQWWEFLS